MKIAKVIPIYKAKEKELFSNYRPISLLPAFSKILEKIMYKRINIFLEQNNIIYPSQYGFRKKHSTIHAILEFINDTIGAIESKNSTLSVFLDLSKAFDTINHDILLQKMEFYGIRGIAHDWMKSYLSNRSQFVRYQNCSSNKKSTTCGIPQGSVLGPLLFIIYTNDLPDCLSRSKGILFADDTTVYLSSKNTNELYTNMSADLTKLADWFHANKLSLNVNKTNCMLITNINESASHKYTLKIGNDVIERKTCVKFLGLHLDDRLTWHEHIKVCKSKAASSIYAINRIKNIVPKRYMHTLYFTLVYPYFAYGIPLWGGTYNVHKKNLITMQKRVIRIISGAKYNDHTGPLFKQAHILKLDDIYKMETLKIVYSCIHKDLPTPLGRLFTLNSEIHKRNTRQQADLHTKKCRTTLASQHIESRGPHFWNSLTTDIKTTHFPRIKRFTKEVIKIMIQGY